MARFPLGFRADVGCRDLKVDENRRLELDQRIPFRPSRHPFATNAILQEGCILSKHHRWRPKGERNQFRLYSKLRGHQMRPENLRMPARTLSNSANLERAQNYLCCVFLLLTPFEFCCFCFLLSLRFPHCIGGKL